MKKYLAALIVALLLTSTSLRSQNLVDDFADINFWTGTGPNQAALVFQWNDGLAPLSLAWGFRWEGQATGMDMLLALAGNTQISDPLGDPVGSEVGADSRLKLGLVQYSFGLSLVSVDYSASEAEERTQDDWFNGYWEYFIQGGDFEYYDYNLVDTALYDEEGSPVYSPTGWTSSPVGASDRPLIDGAWDAFSFAPSYVSQAVEQPEAAPSLTFEIVEGVPSLTCPTVAGYTYQLEYNESLDAPWSPMGAAVPGDDEALTFNDESPTLPRARFYRIDMVPSS